MPYLRETGICVSSLIGTLWDFQVREMLQNLRSQEERMDQVCLDCNQLKNMCQSVGVVIAVGRYFILRELNTV